VIEHERPDWVVTVGDVNSTLAAALAAAKLRPTVGCRVAHVEAGLRSGDWSMPEEVNRVLTDRLSDLLLTTEADAVLNLAAEGIPAERVVFAGNIMIDTLLASLERARAARSAAIGEYALVTLHRPSNVDEPRALETILRALARLAEECAVVLPVHPRTRARIAEFALDGLLERIDARPPVGYLDMVGLLDGAAVVLTDSGGVQEESTVLGVPCLTLRASTERPVTVTEGTNRLADWPLTEDGILAGARDRRSRGRSPVGAQAPAGWDGRAAVRIVDALVARA
jgi:UDP-N-acetylglucosamine 2-epimerase (non-hydrolysing)